MGESEPKPQTDGADVQIGELIRALASANERIAALEEAEARRVGAQEPEPRAPEPVYAHAAERDADLHSRNDAAIEKAKSNEVKE